MIFYGTDKEKFLPVFFYVSIIVKGLSVLMHIQIMYCFLKYGVDTSRRNKFEAKEEIYSTGFARIWGIHYNLLFTNNAGVCALLLSERIQ